MIFRCTKSVQGTPTWQRTFEAQTCECNRGDYRDSPDWANPIHDRDSTLNLEYGYLMANMILALWSAPRSRSTAFLRMMMQRGDFYVLHEPFSHLADFGDTNVAGEAVGSEPELMEAIRALAEKNPVFFKDTTDFRYPGLLADTRFLREVTHTFIIRNPSDAIASHYRLNPRLTCDEVGFSRLYEIFEAAMRVTPKVPPVVDADDLVDDPVAIVREYCRAVGIPFVEKAMSWEPGMPEAWRRAPRWHDDAGRSAGFERAEESSPDDISNNPLLSEYIRHHLPYYEKLREYALATAGQDIG